MIRVQPTTNDRIKSALAAIAVQALIGYALIVGLAVHFSAPADEPLKLFAIAPPPPSPPEIIKPDPAPSKRREGAASPPNLHSKATEIVAPMPIVQIIVPPPIVSAEKLGIGADPASGTADVRGPGTGSGGVGNGTGSGGRGNGGGGYDDETPPRWLRGTLKDSDYPGSAGEGGFQGAVGVRFLVAITGRVTECDVTRSSGNAELDATTCRLIEKRYRYAPSRDARGHPVPALIVENHSWVIDDETPAPRS